MTLPALVGLEVKLASVDPHGTHDALTIVFTDGTRLVAYGEHGLSLQVLPGRRQGPLQGVVRK